MGSVISGIRETKKIYDVLIENKGNVKITKEQIYKIKEEADKFRETHKEMEFTVKFDASRFINIKPYKKSLNVKYFIKPIGSSDKPYPDKTIMPTDIYFSRRYPKAVTENDILICYAVGNGRLLGYYLVTSEKALKASESKENRWPYFIESECLSQLYSNHWWDFELFLTSLEKEFNELYQDKTITSSGGRTLGSLQFGNDKIQITEEFAQFLIDKIYNISK